MPLSIHRQDTGAFPEGGIISISALPNDRGEWCRAKDARMQTEADSRHPLHCAGWVIAWSLDIESHDRTNCGNQQGCAPEINQASQLLLPRPILGHPSCGRNPAARKHVHPARQKGGRFPRRTQLLVTDGSRKQESESTDARHAREEEKDCAHSVTTQRGLYNGPSVY